MNKTWWVWTALVVMFLAPAAQAGRDYSLSYTIGSDYGYTTVGYDRYGHGRDYYYGHDRGYRYDRYRHAPRPYYSYRPYRYYDYRPYRYDGRRYNGYRHDYRPRGGYYRNHSRRWW